MAKNEGGKYEHFTGKMFESRDMGENSSDKRAMSEGKTGMQGKQNPKFEIMERERGDASAKARAAREPFEAQEFDINQWDQKED